MMVLVDTCIWSLALRRQGASGPEVRELTSLIESRRVVIIGPIRQELLSGVPQPHLFRQLKKRLDPFPDLHLDTSDYVEAARLFNTCRGKGIQGSNTDFLICAAAMRHRLAVYTNDCDFVHISRCIPLQLHSAGNV